MNERIRELMMQSWNTYYNEEVMVHDFQLCTVVQKFDVEKFAELVRADEREACAKVCDDWPEGREDVYSIAQAIRARGGE